MTYIVTFYSIPQEREDYSVFQDIEHARAFIESRHEGYGKSYKIIEESEDGTRKTVK